MSIEPLLAALGGDAEDDVRAIDESARATAAQIRAEAEAHVAQRCAAALESHESELRRMIDGRRAHALRRSRETLLAARSAFLDRVFAAAERDTAGVLLQPERGAAMAWLLHEALAFVPSGASVACRPELAARLNGAALGDAHVRPDPDVAEGVVVTANDGSLRIDNTLQNRLRWLRPALSIELIKQFEGTA